MRHSGAPADTAGDTTAGDGRGRVRGEARQQERAPLLSRPLASYYLLLSTAGLLVVFGLIMVLSSSSVTAYAADKSPYYFFLKQALWVGLGIPFMLLVSRLPVRALRVVGLPLLVVTTALLVLLLVPGFGRSVNGSTRWIGFGPVVVQPSELVKLALALWGAGLLSARRRQAERRLASPPGPAGARRDVVRHVGHARAGHGHDRRHRLGHARAAVGGGGAAADVRGAEPRGGGAGRTDGDP